MLTKLPISILSLLIMMPITLSFKFGGGIGFDRLGGFNNQEWLLSMPISIFFGLWLSIKYFNKIIGKIDIILLSCMAFFVISIKIIFIGQIDYSILKILFSLLMFILFILAFCEYFNNNLKVKSNLDSVENAYILYPLALVILVTLICWQLSNNFLELLEVRGRTAMTLTGAPFFITQKILINWI